MHDRRMVLGGFGAVAALVTTGARANIAMPAVIRHPEHSLLAPAREEMMAFLREELIKGVTDRRIYEVMIQVNERMIRRHPEAVDPTKRMRKSQERFGPGEHDQRFAQTRRLSGNIPFQGDMPDRQYSGLIDRTVADLAEEIAADERLTQTFMPGYEQRHLVPVFGLCCVSPETFTPMITFLTTRCYAPIGAVWL